MKGRNGCKEERWLGMDGRFRNGSNKQNGKEKGVMFALSTE